MSGHTPGPWRVGSASGHSGRPRIVRRDGRTICRMELDCVEADARLIAAAPELLAAIKAIIESKALSAVEQLVTGWRGPADKPNPDHPKNLGATIKTTCGRMYRLDEALKMASTAIAKAEGR